MCTINHNIKSKKHDEVCIEQIITKEIQFFLYFSLLDTELRSYLNLHPPIAKRALYCICALHPEKKDEIMQTIIDVISLLIFKMHRLLLLLLGHIL
jgi:hypothetical protein